MRRRLRGGAPGLLLILLLLILLLLLLLLRWGRLQALQRVGEERLRALRRGLVLERRRTGGFDLLLLLLRLLLLLLRPCHQARRGKPQLPRSPAIRILRRLAESRFSGPGC